MKTLTKSSFIAKTRQADHTQMQKVCELLKWDEQQYCNHQFEQYTDFLTRMFMGWPDIMLRQVLYSPTMRGFFNNEWSKRTDVEFFSFAKDLIAPVLEVDESGTLISLEGMPLGDCYLIDEYCCIHSSRGLINNDAFMIKYNDVLKMVRKEKVC